MAEQKRPEPENPGEAGPTAPAAGEPAVAAAPDPGELGPDQREPAVDVVADVSARADGSPDQTPGYQVIDAVREQTEKSGDEVAREKAALSNGAPQRPEDRAEPVERTATTTRPAKRGQGS